MEDFFFNQVPKSEYASVLIVAAFFNTPFSGKT